MLFLFIDLKQYYQFLTVDTPRFLSQTLFFILYFDFVIEILTFNFLVPNFTIFNLVIVFIDLWINYLQQLVLQAQKFAVKANYWPRLAHHIILCNYFSICSDTKYRVFLISLTLCQLFEFASVLNLLQNLFDELDFCNHELPYLKIFCYFIKLFEESLLIACNINASWSFSPFQLFFKYFKDFLNYELVFVFSLVFPLTISIH